MQFLIEVTQIHFNLITGCAILHILNSDIEKLYWMFCIYKYLCYMKDIWYFWPSKGNKWERQMTTEMSHKGSKFQNIIYEEGRFFYTQRVLICVITDE